MCDLGCLLRGGGIVLPTTSQGQGENIAQRVRQALTTLAILGSSPDVEHHFSFHV